MQAFVRVANTGDGVAACANCVEMYALSRRRAAVCTHADQPPLAGPRWRHRGGLRSKFLVYDLRSKGLVKVTRRPSDDAMRSAHAYTSGNPAVPGRAPRAAASIPTAGSVLAGFLCSSACSRITQRAHLRSPLYTPPRSPARAPSDRQSVVRWTSGTAEMLTLAIPVTQSHMSHAVPPAPGCDDTRGRPLNSLLRWALGGAPPSTSERMPRVGR